MKEWPNSQKIKTFSLKLYFRSQAMAKSIVKGFHQTDIFWKLMVFHQFLIFYEKLQNLFRFIKIDIHKISMQSKEIYKLYNSSFCYESIS
jgi:hypothetical protein